ncbi:hypothetical protein EGY19_04475 [Burkholderia multivorans]|nr:hypothetical protein EGY19_04475 [Burkholderia multivorans]PRF43062.1 hypothetical protein C6Q04_29055 [Burkholderia multivorans]PRG47670.1 hypothetical protein C6T63_25855 [Burkholderia multivorans]
MRATRASRRCARRASRAAHAPDTGGPPAVAQTAATRPGHERPALSLSPPPRRRAPSPRPQTR